MFPKTLLITLTLAGALHADDDATKDRIDNASTVLKEMLDAPDKGVPRNLFAKSVCVVVIPSVKKAGFIVGAKYGRGFASCKTAARTWSAPAGMRIEGGSFGLQAGGAATDVILLIRNEEGMKKLLQDKFTIGGEASAAAGPVGRDAEAMTDAMMHAEILSYSRSRGVFGGISLQGATLRPDDDANKDLYKTKVANADVLSGKTPAPAEASAFLGMLGQFSTASK
jgi:SH3 domain-containing YSC84-like protein 1